MLTYVKIIEINLKYFFLIYVNYVRKKNFLRTDKRTDGRATQNYSIGTSQKQKKIWINGIISNSNVSKSKKKDKRVRFLY